GVAHLQTLVAGAQVSREAFGVSELAVAVLHPAGIADELDGRVLAVGVASELDAVGVAGAERDAGGRVEQASLGRPLGAGVLELDGTGRIAAVPPLGDVERVGAEIRHLPAGIIQVEPEAVEAAVFVIWHAW